MFKRLLSYLRTRAIIMLPAGMTADKSAFWGLFALMSNVNNYAESLATVVTAGTNTLLTPAQLLSGIVRLTTGWSGGATITLPSTAAIISALGPTIALDGSYAEPISFQNDGTGQTGTVTPGDAGTTITGTATVATNTRRLYLLTVLSPTTISLQNIGSVAL